MALPEDEYSPGELFRGIERIEKQLEVLNTALAREYTSLSVWQQRNALVDGKLSGLGREIGDLRTEVRSARVPWTSVASVVVSVAALVVVLIQSIGR